MATRPLSERALEVACFGFALWTLCAHVVVFAGGSLRGLVVLFGGSLLVLAAARVALHRRGAAVPTPAPPEPEPAAADPARDAPWALRARIGLAVIGAGAALLLAPREHPIALWCALVLVLGTAAVLFLLREAPHFEPARTGRVREGGLLALAVLCALYTLVVHRPDPDDAFYANVAVAAVEHPEVPLLARDTLHGRFDLPVHLPSYRLHSYEVAVAALSLLSGVAALPLFHLVAGPLAALFVPLAHAALFRLLAPRVWLFATAALLLVLAAPGETHRWYGNFAFVRMWQGKAILLSVAAPWIAALALRFALAPSRAAWLRLAAAQIAALGASASALWLAPAISLAAMASVLRPGRRDLRVLGLGALTSAYPIAAALAQKSGMLERAPHLAERFAPGQQLGSSLAAVLGEATLLRVAVAALCVAWACWGRGLARRYAIALPLAVTLVLLTPWADALVRANVTGPSFWRALWALPLPILIALVIAAPLQWERAGAPRPAARVAAAALLLLFAVAVPRRYGFDAENNARLAWPGLRVPTPAFAWAERVNALAPGERVVAPRSISIWIPTLPHPAYPLAVRSYLSPLRELVGETAYRDRNVMTYLVGGTRTHPEAEAIFAQGLALYDVAAVCLRTGSGPAPALRAILQAEGYRRRAMGTQVEIWVRDGEALEEASRAPHGAAQP